MSYSRHDVELAVQMTAQCSHVERNPDGTWFAVCFGGGAFQSSCNCPTAWDAVKEAVLKANQENRRMGISG